MPLAALRRKFVLNHLRISWDNLGGSILSAQHLLPDLGWAGERGVVSVSREVRNEGKAWGGYVPPYPAEYVSRVAPLPNYNPISSRSLRLSLASTSSSA